MSCPQDTCSDTLMHTDTLLHTNAHTCNALTCHTQRCTRSGTQIIIPTGAHTEMLSLAHITGIHSCSYTNKHMPTETHAHAEMLTPCTQSHRSTITHTSHTASLPNAQDLRCVCVPVSTLCLCLP